MNFKSAPLPFQGQKRRFAAEFHSQLSDLAKTNDVKIVVDLFGGSGLLSRIAKDVFPSAKVIYNDYDDYSQRLRNVDNTNTLLSDIRSIVGDYPKEKKINEDFKSVILNRISQEIGFVDYITLSASLLFSAKYATDFASLEKETFYNNIKSSNYTFNSEDYLRGLTIVCESYKVLFERYRNDSDVLFLVDPPYLSTDTGTYHNDKYWKLRDYLDVLKVLIGTRYFFFTSNKSHLLDLCEWLEGNQPFINPFENSALRLTENQLNHTAKYTDMMLCKI